MHLFILIQAVDASSILNDDVQSHKPWNLESIPQALQQHQQRQTPDGLHLYGRAALCCHPPSHHCCTAAAACGSQHSNTSCSSTPQRSPPAHSCGSCLQADFTMLCCMRTDSHTCSNKRMTAQQRQLPSCSSAPQTSLPARSCFSCLQVELMSLTVCLLTVLLLRRPTAGMAMLRGQQCSTSYLVISSCQHLSILVVIAFKHSHHHRCVLAGLRSWRICC